MNNHILKLLAVLALSLPFSPAWSSPKDAPSPIIDKSCYPFSFDIEIAAFFPLGSTIRSIYGAALPSFTFAENWWFHESWDVWLDISYVFGNGHSTGYDHKPSHLSFVPITAGIKYVYQLRDFIDLYVGAGPCYSFLYTVDHSPYAKKNTSTSNFGAIVKSGLLYYFHNRWFVQGFFNYMYQKMYFHQTDSDPFVYRYSANLSSLQLGGGVGIKF